MGLPLPSKSRTKRLPKPLRVSSSKVDSPQELLSPSLTTSLSKPPLTPDSGDSKLERPSLVSREDPTPTPPKPSRSAVPLSLPEPTPSLPEPPLLSAPSLSSEPDFTYGKFSIKSL